MSLPAFDSLHYCDSGKYLLAVSAWLGKAYVLDTKTYQPHAAIDIVTSSVRSTPKQNYGHDTIFRADCAANGNIAAFQTSPNAPRPSFGGTKIYNLDSGEEVSGLDEIALLPLVGGVVVSPSGNNMRY